ncbi:MAG: hypothetical protein AAFR38_05045 [Planctomycetota bacterium]
MHLEKVFGKAGAIAALAGTSMALGQDTPRVIWEAVAEAIPYVLPTTSSIYTGKDAIPGFVAANAPAKSRVPLPPDGLGNPRDGFIVKFPDRSSDSQALDLEFRPSVIAPDGWVYFLADVKEDPSVEGTPTRGLYRVPQTTIGAAAAGTPPVSVVTPELVAYEGMTVALGGGTATLQELPRMRDLRLANDGAYAYEVETFDPATGRFRPSIVSNVDSPTDPPEIIAQQENSSSAPSPADVNVVINALDNNAEVVLDGSGNRPIGLWMTPEGKIAIPVEFVRGSNVGSQWNDILMRFPGATPMYRFLGRDVPNSPTAAAPDLPVGFSAPVTASGASPNLINQGDLDSNINASFSDRHFAYIERLRLDSSFFPFIHRSQTPGSSSSMIEGLTGAPREYLAAFPAALVPVSDFFRLSTLQVDRSLSIAPVRQSSEVGSGGSVDLSGEQSHIAYSWTFASSNATFDFDRARTPAIYVEDVTIFESEAFNSLALPPINRANLSRGFAGVLDLEVKGQFTGPPGSTTPDRGTGVLRAGSESDGAFATVARILGPIAVSSQDEAAQTESLISLTRNFSGISVYATADLNVAVPGEDNNGFQFFPPAGQTSATVPNPRPVSTNQSRVLLRWDNAEGNCDPADPDCVLDPRGWFIIAGDGVDREIRFNTDPVTDTGTPQWGLGEGLAVNATDEAIFRAFEPFPDTSSGTQLGGASPHDTILYYTEDLVTPVILLQEDLAQNPSDPDDPMGGRDENRILVYRPQIETPMGGSPTLVFPVESVAVPEFQLFGSDGRPGSNQRRANRFRSTSDGLPLAWNDRRELVVNAETVTQFGSAVPVTEAVLRGSFRPGTADVAVPFGVVSQLDVQVFTNAWFAQDPLADVATPFGVYTQADVTAFTLAWQAAQTP